MPDINQISKQELLELIESLIDGIDGVASEQGEEELNRFWDMSKVDTARALVYEEKLR